jgi:hypothetical protein
MQRKNKMTKIFFLIALLSASLANANAKIVGNGGDLCEDHFKIIRDDIKTWIDNGGSSGLRFPKELTLQQYNTKILDKIANAQISCVNHKIEIDGAEKTCRNFVDTKGQSEIECNMDRFMYKTSQSDQYILVHHEYAGLAGFETSADDDSKYSLSNQITEYLQDVTVKRLAIKTPVVTTSTNPLSCIAKGSATQCSSIDKQYQIVLTDHADWEDFSTGLGLTNLCTKAGFLKLNGRVMSSDEVTIQATSSIHGLTVQAPDKTLVTVNAMIHISGNWNKPPFVLPGFTDVEGVQILVSDKDGNRNVQLYLENSDMKSSSKINLICQPPES